MPGIASLRTGALRWQTCLTTMQAASSDHMLLSFAVALHMQRNAVMIPCLLRREADSGAALLAQSEPNMRAGAMRRCSNRFRCRTCRGNLRAPSVHAYMPGRC